MTPSNQILADRINAALYGSTPRTATIDQIGEGVGGDASDIIANLDSADAEVRATAEAKAVILAAVLEELDGLNTPGE